MPFSSRGTFQTSKEQRSVARRKARFLSEEAEALINCQIAKDFEQQGEKYLGEKGLRLTCLVCGKRLESVNDELQPYDGVICLTGGNYGSTVFDPMNGSTALYFVLCDQCLVAKKDYIYLVRGDAPPEVYNPDKD